MKKLLALFIVMLAFVNVVFAQGDSIRVWTTSYFPVVHHEATLTIFFKNTGNYGLYNFTTYLSSPMSFNLIKVRMGDMIDSLAIVKSTPYEDGYNITVYNNLKPIKKGVGTLLYLTLWTDEETIFTTSVVFDGRVYHGFESRTVLYWNGWDVSSEFIERMIREEVHESSDTLNFTTYLTIPLKPKLSGFINSGDSLIITAADQLARSVAYYREGGSGLEAVVKLKFDPRKFYQNFQYWKVYKLLPPFTNVNNLHTILRDFHLEQNYPNPFNPTTTIHYNIPHASPVILAVFNMQGRKIKTLIKGERAVGEYSVIWDGTDDNGNHVASGVYVINLSAGDYSTSIKATFLDNSHI